MRLPAIKGQVGRPALPGPGLPQTRRAPPHSSAIKNNWKLSHVNVFQPPFSQIADQRDSLIRALGWRIVDTAAMDQIGSPYIHNPTEKSRFGSRQQVSKLY